MPTVSVIMATYNQAGWIRKTVESVLAQTYQDFEIIVIDDGSTDNTRQIILEAISSDKIKYYYQKNCGAAGARNAGLRSAAGEYVIFLDSDDLLHPEYLEHQTETMRSTNSGMAVCDFNFLYWDGTKKANKIVLAENDQLFQFLVRNKFPPVALLIKRQNILDIGGFDEAISSCEDYDLTIRLLAAGARMTHTREVLCDYFIHPESMSSDLYKHVFNLAKTIDKINSQILHTPGLLSFEQLKALMDNNLLFFHRCLALKIDTRKMLPNVSKLMEKVYAERGGLNSFVVRILGYSLYNRLMFFKSSFFYPEYGKMLLDQVLDWRRKG